jgi:hypothetical protein
MHADQPYHARSDQPALLRRAIAALDQGEEPDAPRIRARDAKGRFSKALRD